MAKTIKNTKNKQKSTKSQKPTLEQKINTLKEILIETNEGIVDVSKTGIALARRVNDDFQYHEDMRKIQDEYIESSFKAIRWLFIALCFAGLLLSVFVSVKTNKIETRLTQLEATYEISRRD